MGKKGRNANPAERDDDIEALVATLGFMTFDGIPILSEPVWRKRAYEIAAWLSSRDRRGIADRLRHASPVRRPVKVKNFATQFALTPAETRLVESLARGATVAEHAAERGISVNTARVHMQRVLEKTGAHRQANLVRMLLA